MSGVPDEQGLIITACTAFFFSDSVCPLSLCINDHRPASLRNNFYPSITVTFLVLVVIKIEMIKINLNSLSQPHDEKLQKYSQKSYGLRKKIPRP